MMFLSRLLARRIISNPGEHVDANMLAAFGEHALTARRRAAMFAHIAECEACRQWVAAYSALRDLDRGSANSRELRSFRLLSTNSLRITAAAGVVCALLFFAAISPHYLRMKTPAQVRSEAPLEIADTSRTAAENEPSPAIKRRTIGETRLHRFHARMASDRPYIALWRTAWVRPVVLTAPSLDKPGPRLPGPLGQTRLARNLNFAANFSIEEALLPSLNQIAVHTNLGERWITLDRLSERVWVHF